MKTKNNLYEQITKEIRDHGAIDENELKSRAAYCCYVFNEDIVDENERRKRSDDMAETFIGDFRLFLTSVNLLPRNFEGDMVKNFQPNVGELIFPMVWFAHLTKRADNFSIMRLNAMMQ